MAAFGLVPDAPVLAPSPVFYLWPENVQAWTVFLDCGTQWRWNGGSREGLDYPGVQIVIDDAVGRPRRRKELRRAVRIMECAALDAWRQKAAEEE